MLKRVSELEERAYQLAVDVRATRPKQYADRENSEGDDEVALAWNEAAAAVGAAANSMDALLFYLEEKAGLDADGEQQARELRRLFPDMTETAATTTT
ncbi:MAG: hypothetical protein ABFC77_05795 [Thermoguttaceae bacterium]